VGVVVERVEIDNGAGVTIPGDLVLPPAALAGRRCPAIIYHHWHGDQFDVGRRSLFAHEHTPVVPAADLAARGYVVLCIDAYGFGERSGQGPGGAAERGSDEELSASKLALWLGQTRWGQIVRDDRIALDYLASRPEVDARRIGATGMSMGATRTWWLMALDDRIAAGVAVGCMTRYADLIAARALSAHGIYYYVPGVLTHFDTEAIIACAAPRPLLFLTGDRDAGSPPRGMRAIASAARRIYQLHEQPRHFRSVVYPGIGHVYTRDMWQRMTTWMQKHL
jgi:dienelactone hydrolase